MVGVELVWKTLDYGRKTLTDASWLTLATIMIFLAMMFMLFKLQWVLITPGKSSTTKTHTHKSGKKTDYNMFIKILPTIIGIILFAVFLQWVIGKNIEYKRVTWQSDYFIAFMVTLFLFGLLAFYEMKLMLRRTISWMIINNMFKLVLVIFTGLIFALYYILATSKQESFWDGGYWTYGFIIFMVYTIICFYAFRMSPLSSLIPMVVLWGADISYYTSAYALRYGVLGNGSGIIVVVFSLFGISIFKGIARHQRIASPEFMLAYTMFLFAVIVGMWFALWTYYEYPFFGTDHESFFSRSFYQ